jgi:hypothetical protein
VSLNSSTNGSCSPTDSNNGVPDHTMSSNIYYNNMLFIYQNNVPKENYKNSPKLRA